MALSDEQLDEMYKTVIETHVYLKGHVENKSIHQLPPCSNMKRAEKGILALLCGMAYLLLQKMGLA